MQQLGPYAVGESANGKLGATVGGLQGDRPVRERGPHLHDGPTVTGKHPVHRRHGAVHGAEVGHLGGATIFLGTDVGELSEDRRHRVIDPHVDWSERGFGFLSRGLDRFGIRDVGGDCQSPAAHPLDFTGRVLETGLAAGEQDDVRSSTSECVGHGPADTRRSPGDHYGFLVSLRHGQLLAEDVSST